MRASPVMKIVLPDAAAGKVAVLIFGFTKASKVPTSAWAEKLQADLGTRSEFELYQLPVLESVPRPPPRHGNFRDSKGHTGKQARSLRPHPARRGGTEETCSLQRN